MLNQAQIDACAAYVVAQAKHVCETFGDRDPGSEGESATQDYVCDELRAHVDGDPVKEPFDVGPRAFMGFQRVTGVILLIGIAAYWWQPVVSVIAGVLSLFIAVQVLLRYKLFLEPFCSKRTSHNVAAARKPKGELKRRIIINGHADAVYEWRWYYLAPKLFPLVVLYGLISAPLLIVVSLLCAIFNWGWADGYANVWSIVGIVPMMLVPAGVILILFSDFKTVVPGANDNLTGTFITVGLAKWIGESDLRLENTEIMYLVTGSEEAGLRGAKAYAKRHKADLSDVETVFVAIDTIRDMDHFKIYNKDLNGRVEHDMRVARLFKSASEKRGLDLPYGSVSLGSSDATAFTQEGIASIALAAMDPAPADYYHTRKDTPDNMNEACIAQCIGVVAEALLLYDEGGLAAYESA